MGFIDSKIKKALDGHIGEISIKLEKLIKDAQEINIKKMNKNIADIKSAIDSIVNKKVDLRFKEWEQKSLQKK